MSSIFRYRTRLGLTQQELGWRAGISRIDIRKLERGILQPSAEQLDRLADAFGINVKELLPAYYPPCRSEAEFNVLEADLKYAQLENERLRARNERLQAENSDLWMRLAMRPASSGLSGTRDQDHEMVKDLLSLIKISHPDRHGGQALAVELTQALLTLKAKYEGRKAPLG